MVEGGTADRAPDWARALSEPALRLMFGADTFHRGAAYYRKKAVVDLRVAQNGTSLMATVQGSRRYTTVVTVTPSVRAGSTISGHCSCPMRADCKHVVAVVLQAQGLLLTGEGNAVRDTTAQWERLLGAVVQNSPGSEQPPAGGVPLALHVELVEVTRPKRRPGFDAGPVVHLRPMMLSATGNWIRTGIAWRELEYAYHRGPVDPAQHEALLAILRTARIRSSSSYYYAPGQSMTTDELGSDLWQLLQQASAAGVELRSGQKGERSVLLLPEPAEVVVDATRSPSGDITLTSTLQMPGTTAQPVAFGSPARAVAVRTSEGLALARLAKPLSGPLAALVDTTSLTVPAPDVPRFLAGFYPALRRHARVESSNGSVEMPTIAPPRLALRVEFEAEHRTRLLWTFHYTVGDETADVPLARRAAEDPWAGARDVEAEEELLASLEILDAVPGLRIPQAGTARQRIVVEPVFQGWATATFVQNVLPALEARDDVDVTMVGARLDYSEITEPPIVLVSAGELEGTDGAAQEDWFELGIRVTVGEHEVNLANLLTAIGRGEERLLLDGGTWFALDTPQLHALQRIVAEARAMQDHPSGRLTMSRYQAGMWEELVELGIVAHQSERWARSVGGLLALDQVPHPSAPATLDATLRPYQLDGYQWLSFLWDHQLGGILADDMGLGKTLQTLAMAERAREEGSLTPAAPILVVAPTSVVAAWEREAARFTPKLTVATITQTARKSGIPLPEAIAGAHLVVTSYALARLDAEEFEAREWGALILDEAQFVKNHQSRGYQVARMLRAPFKLAITGTPMENSLMDLWSLLSIVAPGLFPTPQRFAELYRKPIESGESPERLTTLRRRIKPLMLRRTKESVAEDLPPKIEQVVSVALNTAHRKIYDTHLQRERQRVLGLLDDVDRNRIAILTALTKLRQLSLDVHLVAPDAPATVRSSKIDALMEQLVEVVAEGHRCLVFSQFTGFLGMVRQRLVAEGIDHVYLDGRTRDRPKRIAQFTDGTAPVFLISLKAGGSGLTLTQADYVFVLDPWWNPAVEAQAVDRAHRIGQDKTVMVYRLVSEGTIEEKVVALQERKREIFARVVDDGGLMGAPLSADDIRGLLGG